MHRRKKDNWDTHIIDLVSAFEAESDNTFLSPESFHELIDFYETEEQFEKALAAARLPSRRRADGRASRGFAAA